MIYAIIGMNGSGKTLTMTRELTKYDFVFCNYNYKGTEKQKVVMDYNSVILFYKLTYLVHYLTVPRILKEHIKIAFAIDEGGLNFPARSWKSLTSEEAFLFAQHRKMGGMDFFYTSQSFTMIDKILRSNTAYTMYPEHIFRFFYVNVCPGIKRAKGTCYPFFFYATNRLYKLYNTYEVVESTKFYFEKAGSAIKDFSFLDTLQIPHSTNENKLR